MNVLLLRWDTKPDKRIRRTFPTPDQKIEVLAHALTLATGYLLIRGAVETATYVIVAITWLALVPLAETMSAGPGTASPSGVRLGTFVFCLGAAMFYDLLFRSRIVPRWITVWGLLGIPLYVAAYLLAMYGVVGINSFEVNLLCLPLAVQEMVLAVWMIARGFRPAAVANTPEP